MDVKIEESWKALLQEEFDKPYFAELIAFVKNEYAQTRIFPPGKLIFNAFNHCTVDNTKVVILGQDPYHGPGQAHGLCFPCPKVSSNRLPCKIYLKKYTMTWVLLFPVRATWNAGRTRGYCCSMQRLPYGPPSRFAPEQRLGNFHRCRYPQDRRKERTPGIPVVGILCPTQRRIYRYRPAPGA